MNNHYLVSILRSASLVNKGSRHSSVVECLLIVRWVVGSIPQSGSTDLFLGGAPMV